MTNGERLAGMLDSQAAGCTSLGSPLYAALLTRAAEDVRAGGVIAEALDGYADFPFGYAVALRLLGAVHALALTGRAPDLAAHYPSTGGAFDPRRPDAAWPAFRAAVADNRPWVRDWLTRPPQTNEVARSNLLITGLLRAVSAFPLPVRLLEIGSSAGFNLRPDHYRYEADGYAWGPADSPVRLTDAWDGPPPRWLTEAAEARPALTVVERRGCDLNPIDPLSADGGLALRAYVWADQSARLARLDGALSLAAKEPVSVERVGAADFLAGVRPRPGTLTVVWHSVMRMYVDPGEWQSSVQRELDRLAEESTPGAPFAYLAMEPWRPDHHRCELSLRLGAGPLGVLAEVPPHGLPAVAR